MAQRSSAIWRATTPHIPAQDAVEAALDRSPAEQLIPAVPGGLTPLARERLEAKFLQVFGRALFADVARMIDVDRRFR